MFDITKYRRRAAPPNPSDGAEPNPSDWPAFVHGLSSQDRDRLQAALAGGSDVLAKRQADQRRRAPGGRSPLGADPFEADHAAADIRSLYLMACYALHPGLDVGEKRSVRPRYPAETTDRLLVADRLASLAGLDRGPVRRLVYDALPQVPKPRQRTSTRARNIVAAFLIDQGIRLSDERIRKMVARRS